MSIHFERSRRVLFISIYYKFEFNLAEGRGTHRESGRRPKAPGANEGGFHSNTKLSSIGSDCCRYSTHSSRSLHFSFWICELAVISIQFRELALISIQFLRTRCKLNVGVDVRTGLETLFQVMIFIFQGVFEVLKSRNGALWATVLFGTLFQLGFDE